MKVSEVRHEKVVLFCGEAVDFYLFSIFLLIWSLFDEKELHGMFSLRKVVLISFDSKSGLRNSIRIGTILIDRTSKKILFKLQKL